MKTNPELDLTLERTIDIPAEAIWQAWTRPELLKQWFCPLPWKTTECEIELRPGGIFRTVMQGPEGERHDGTGIYLEVVPNKRLVWTDALLPGQRPSGKAFMTGVLELEDLGNGKTLYRASALHADAATCKQHREMGFEEGWGMALDQLVALVKKSL